MCLIWNSIPFLFSGSGLMRLYPTDGSVGLKQKQTVDMEPQNLPTVGITMMESARAIYGWTPKTIIPRSI